MNRGRTSGMRKTGCLILVFVMCFGALAGFPRQSSAHTETQLGLLEGFGTSVADINSQGQIVGQGANPGSPRGFVVDPIDNPDGSHTWFWEDPTHVPVDDGVNDLMVNLGSISLGYVTHAWAINDLGWIVGGAQTGPTLDYYVSFRIVPTDVDGDGHPEWFWENPDHLPVNDGVNDLMVNLGTDGYQAADINNHGVIVGGRYQAYVYTEATGWMPLGSLGGTWCQAKAINDNGVIVGMSADSEGHSHTFVIEPVKNPDESLTWFVDDGSGNNALMKSLGEGSSYQAWDVNIEETVVGCGWLGSPAQSHALMWEKVGSDWVETDLWGLNGIANGINDMGYVVGRHGSTAVMYVDGDMHTLSSTMGTAAVEINYRGEICGQLGDYPVVWTPSMPPEAAFVPTTTDLLVAFDASGSYDNEGMRLSYDWDFGDGTTGTGMTISHSYASQGAYLATLTVMNDYGLSDQMQVTVYPTNPGNNAPVAAFTFASNGVLSYAFDGSGSSDSDGTIVSYAWEFGDGGTDTGVSPTHIYSIEDLYDVTLTVTDDDGASSSMTTTVDTSTAWKPPVVVCSANPNYLRVAFDASGSYDPDGTIVSYSWDFGDYKTSTLPSPEHDYWAAGDYEATVTVVDDDGLSSTGTIGVTVTVAPLPEPEAAIKVLRDQVIGCHDPNGYPIDEHTLECLMNKVLAAEQVIGARKVHGNPTAFEARKVHGADLLCVFNTMVEIFTLTFKVNSIDGWEMTCESDFIIALMANQVRISGVPNYEWHHGCGPTAAGMIIAYWDSQGFEGLVKGTSGMLQTPEVNRMIASPEHVTDYALVPDATGRTDDSEGPLIPDKSETGGAHDDNCLADYMHTSRSAAPDQLGYGLSLASMVDDALIDYTLNAPRLTETPNTAYAGYAKEMPMASFTWKDLKTQVDTNHPMLVVVDRNGDGDSDHLVTVVGYCELGSARLYAFHSTWDNTIYWGTFEMMHKGHCYGIFCGFVYDIVNASPAPQ